MLGSSERINPKERHSRKEYAKMLRDYLELLENRCNFLLEKSGYEEVRPQIIEINLKTDSLLLISTSYPNPELILQLEGRRRKIAYAVEQHNPQDIEVVIKDNDELVYPPFEAGKTFNSINKISKKLIKTPLRQLEISRLRLTNEGLEEEVRIKMAAFGRDINHINIWGEALQKGPTVFDKPKAPMEGG